MLLDRRAMLRQAGAGAAALVLTSWTHAQDKPGFKLPKLPYAYDALEPTIDKLTMEIHHDKHHQAYVDNLNKALAAEPDLFKMPIDAILRNIDKVKPEIKQAVINNGGGHANHTMFWEIMGPKGGGKPAGELAKAIDSTFTSLDKLQEQINAAGLARFGSGWSWLILGKDKKLAVISTANQDSPLLTGATPILGIDVWEHAYYLKYQNRRADYVKAWWNVVNWTTVGERFNNALKG
ncbi:superoxide dismutase [Planctomycetaceae bacterium SCGC AG-212-F19]|nr:superoxide dismutase [Planctomycetaceae bacterium SCGC AG-212-F19]